MYYNYMNTSKMEIEPFNSMNSIKDRAIYNILDTQYNEKCNYIDSTTFLSSLSSILPENTTYVELQNLDDETKTYTVETKTAHEKVLEINDLMLEHYNKLCKMIKKIKNDIRINLQEPEIQKQLKIKQNKKIEEGINKRKTIYDVKSREKYYIMSYYIRLITLLLLLSAIGFTFFKGKLNRTKIGIFIVVFIIYYLPIKTYIIHIFSMIDKFILYVKNPVNKNL